MEEQGQIDSGETIKEKERGLGEEGLLNIIDQDDTRWLYTACFEALEGKGGL